mmetsp:Transcript_96231/g.281036  ORF Transcript_96231/g.281036 Transcript_96231/m.281036 type:complete len:233 (-) Transcript_96231:1-699(-)
MVCLAETLALGLVPFPRAAGRLAGPRCAQRRSHVLARGSCLWLAGTRRRRHVPGRAAALRGRERRGRRRVLRATPCSLGRPPGPLPGHQLGSWRPLGRAPGACGHRSDGRAGGHDVPRPPAVLHRGRAAGGGALRHALLPGGRAQGAHLWRFCGSTGAGSGARASLRALPAAAAAGPRLQSLLQGASALHPGLLTLHVLSRLRLGGQRGVTSREGREGQGWQAACVPLGPMF